MEKSSEKIVSLVREALDVHGSQQKLSEAIGVPQSTISKLLNGAKLRMDSLCPILDALGVELVSPQEKSSRRDVCFVRADVVQSGRNCPSPEADDYFAVPLVDDVGAGHAAVPDGILKSWFLVYRYGEAIRGRYNLLAAKILNTATSMIPTLFPGDIVLVDMDDKAVRTGRIYLVKTPDGGGLVKRVSVRDLPREKDYQLTFYSDNTAEFPPEVYSLKNDYENDWSRAIVGLVIRSWSDMTKK